ncbi:MAG: shikimate dehydrogenase [Bacteroidota bacterium]
MRLFGLIGFPLGHSFSKNYFTNKFLSENIPGCQYELFPIKSINELPALLQAHPLLEGLNVTIPYKKDVLEYLSENKLPAGLNACNCIQIRNGLLSGHNTDVAGFEKSLLQVIEPAQRNALILGNGGAADAVAYVLGKLGIQYKIIGRSLKTGIDFTYSQVTPGLIESNSIIINTTPLGTFPKFDECPMIPYEAITNSHLLFDLVYNPAETLFLKKGAAQGAKIQNGYDMLVYQAEEAWRIWNES